MHLIQWNINGFYARLPYLQILQKKTSPSIICLQETNFKGVQCGRLRGYRAFNKNCQDAINASGGVAIYVKDNILTEELLVITNLEAIAVSISDPNKLTICNIYLPRSHNFNLAVFQQLTDQLPKPYIIVGDVNSHNTLWGLPNIDNRGKIVENWIENDNIILVNTGDPTHFNCSSGSFSTIDLSLCSAYIADRVVWSVDSDLFDSDHYPIHIKMNCGKNPCTPSSKPLWKFKEAKWYRPSISQQQQTLKVFQILYLLSTLPFTKPQTRIFPNQLVNIETRR